MQDDDRAYLESLRWPSGPRCPLCASDRVTPRRDGYYRCNACEPALDFTVRTGTILERSHIPIGKWLCALQLPRDITVERLAGVIGVNPRSAWLMLVRLREVLPADPLPLDEAIARVLAHSPPPKSKARKRRERARRGKKEKSML